MQKGRDFRGTALQRKGVNWDLSDVRQIIQLGKAGSEAAALEKSTTLQRFQRSQPET